jgi:hypothetical protein
LVAFATSFAQGTMMYFTIGCAGGTQFDMVNTVVSALAGNARLPSSPAVANTIAAFFISVSSLGLRCVGHAPIRGTRPAIERSYSNELGRTALDGL